MKVLRITVYIFAFLGMIFIPVTSWLLSFQNDFARWVWQKPTRKLAELLHFPASGISSDSVQLYLLLLILLLISILAGSIFQNKLQKSLQFWRPWLRLSMVYYLAWHLFIYGVHKILLLQFYSPEPNILYTHFGMLDKDILYWSTMGTSPVYNRIMGFLEIATAILLVFHRTRFSGLLSAFIILMQIIAINFAFDISVKLFSCFLWFLNLCLLWSYLKTLGSFLFKEAVVKPYREIRPSFSPSLRFFLKTALLLALLSEGMFPYFRDREATKKNALLHGAYEVESMDGRFPIKRFFIHRDGYLILQDTADRMKDYRMKIDPENRMIQLSGKEKITPLIRYQLEDSSLTLESAHPQFPLLLKGRTLNWKQMPALLNPFHWTVEGVE